MNRIAPFLTSSVGRKLLMGLTGFFLCSFLTVHLTINLFLLAQDEGATFDTYAEFMATYPLVRPVEILLFAGFLLHMFIGVWLWWTNRRVRETRYAVNRAADTSDLSSRIMFISGVLVLGFLVVHVNAFFVSSRFFDPGKTMYEMVRDAFANPWTDALYLAAFVVLGYHLRHGFQSAFQTFGLRVPRYEKLIAAIGVIFWLLIPLAFACIPLYFLWNHSSGGN